MSMYEVGTITGAVNQSKVTGVTTKWSQLALGIQEGSILVVYRSGGTDLYAIKSVDSDTQVTLSRNITVAFSNSSYGIITSETASTSAFANQLSSAFSLWRQVVEGWSTALTANGNIIMTDPMTGASVEVPAIKGMAKIVGGNNFTGTQTVDSDDSGIILAKNSDIGLIKKRGTWGKLMVGRSTRFSVVRSDKDRISPTDEQTEIFGITSSGDVDVSGKLSVKNGDLTTKSIELYGPTPFIDFHYNNSTADFTARIICDTPDQLTIGGTNVSVNRNLKVMGLGEFDQDVIVHNGMRVDKTATIYGYINGWGDVAAGRDVSAYVPDGTTVSANPVMSFLRGRGAYYDPRGAYAALSSEEWVGHEHRAIISLNGFGQATYWIFRNDGSLQAPKSFKSLSGRVEAFTGVQAGYLELFVDGGIRGMNFFDSDERKKESIEDVRSGSAADIIRQVRPVSFRYKDTVITSGDHAGELVIGKSYDYGVIAQEIEKLLPSAVNTMSDGMKSLDPLAMIGLLLAHNKELQERLEILENINLEN